MVVAEKEIVGCALATVGTMALFYVSWKLAPVDFLLVMLFGISALVAFLVSANRFIAPIFLTFSIIVARWWLWEYAAVENWRPGLKALLVLAGLTASSGTVAGIPCGQASTAGPLPEPRLQEPEYA